MDERREEREELAEIERETVDEMREQDEARGFWNEYVLKWGTSDA